VVPWGARGAFAVDASGLAIHAPATLSGGVVVDSTGAGDTFIAAMVYALVMGHGPADALRCGCAVAGRKVSRVGFDGLRDAVPEDLRTLGDSGGCSKFI
jgi:sugar/nucleoside kinase (ribokinase family)